MKEEGRGQGRGGVCDDIGGRTPVCFWIVFILMRQDRNIDKKKIHEGKIKQDGLALNIALYFGRSA